MEKIALVTGANGFTGRYMMKALRAAGFRVFGLGHKKVGANACIPCDLTDAGAIAAVVREIRPTHVVHLAARSFVAQEEAQAFYEVNLFGSLRLLDALASLPDIPQKILLASSANVYGTPSLDVIDEDVCPAPVNHYAMSKLAMEHLAATYRDRLPLVTVRPFNYTGIGQNEKFLIPKIVTHFKQCAPVIELGNLDVSRDFSDVRDVVNAYSVLLESPEALGVFNVCSGRDISLRAVLDRMAQIAGYEIEVRVNPAFVRVNEIPRLRGSRVKLESATMSQLDFRPFGQTLEWMYHN